MTETMLACRHVPEHCFVTVLPQNFHGAPLIRIDKGLQNMVMAVSNTTVRIWCPTCFLLKKNGELKLFNLRGGQPDTDLVV